MEDPSPKSLSENLDVKPSFRKPTNDATGRKYRSRLPLGRSDSSSSDGSPTHEWSCSPLPSKNDPAQMSSDQRRNEAGKELERDSHSTRSRSSRGHESEKHKEKYSYSNPHEYNRSDAYSRHDRQTDENDRNYQRSSRSTRNDRLSGRHAEISERRNKENGREYDKGFEKTDSRRKLSRQYDSEHDRYKQRESHEYRNTNHRSPPVCKNDTSSNKGHRAPVDQKRKYHEREGEKHERKTMFSQQEKNVDEASESVNKNNQSSSSREIKDVQHDKLWLSSSRPAGETDSTNKNAEGANLASSAKFVAMQAAELVNKNLVGFGGVGCLSTDQKKKLLWGNKKNSSQESSSSWDHLFSDQERQEKFNRLMGVKGNAAPDGKVENNRSLQAKKHQELDTDLEKQYTAGLRRRDGRTVGLGL
ncbi:splicing regulatory glutamine/lysine-rich protein 1-like isoform X2 [Zingiber officinale]|uniref:splicing regulatory glutamine/lysine-rich protein 1-like isoform X2 n=1 Tax=Zingiber officinale TaxID=94328 RepID=UPI001C4D4FEA|nr:splicing regulatory glutamine/lysine-rich protein 1-like isoform X2 [Zingiber officinale]